MAKLSELCRDVPRELRQGSPIWAMLHREDDVCSEREVASPDVRVSLHDEREARHRDAYIGHGGSIFAECKGQAVRKKCRSHVDRCGQGEYTGEKRFVGSYIHVACRVRIY